MDTQVITSHDVDPPPAERSDHRLAIVLTLVGFGATCLCALLSRRAYFHLDDITHFLYAKWAWHWPRYLLDDWGRPGFTVAYWIPAAFGWMACRIFSALLTALAAWFAYLTARHMSLPRAWLVIPLCYAQPLLFLLAQTTLTETPLAFYLTFAAWLAATRRWTFSSIVLSAAFVTRHEAVIFLPVWIWFAWRDRAKWYSLLPLIWAPLIVNALAAWLGMSCLVLRLLNPTPTAQYGHGGWLTYFLKSLHAFGPAVTILAIVGLRGLLQNPAAKLVTAVVVIYFLAETVVFRFGLFASGGYSRFLVAIGPLVAILAVNGVDRLLSHDAATWRRANLGAAAAMVLLWVSLERQLKIHQGVLMDVAGTHDAIWGIRIATIVLPIVSLLAFALGGSRAAPRRRVAQMLVPGMLGVLLVLTLYAFHHPLPMPIDARIIASAMDRLDTLGYGNRHVVTAHPYVELLAGGTASPMRPTTRERIERAPVGDLIVWESRLTASEDHDIHLDELAANPAFREIFRSEPLPYEKTPYLYIFEKIGPWTAGTSRVASPGPES